MGSWDVGPFDNDDAADWCGDLEDAAAEDRVDVIRQTLTVAAAELDYLDCREGAAAVAAAAVVAAHQPGAAPVTSPYAPDFLTEGGRLDLPMDLFGLAITALDRVMAEDSEWYELWEDAGGEDAFAVVRDLRVQLSER